MSQIPTWQQPINAEAKKQLSKLFNQDAFNQIFKGKDHEQSKQSSNFLSRLCGGEYEPQKYDAIDYFLSRLCGGESLARQNHPFTSFLSRLCGGEFSELGLIKVKTFLSRLCGGEFEFITAT